VYIATTPSKLGAPVLPYPNDARKGSLQTGHILRANGKKEGKVIGFKAGVSHKKNRERGVRSRGLRRTPSVKKDRIL